MPWPIMVGGAIAAAGGIYSALSAKKEAEKNRKFQEKMSNTAHQREVEDLKAAGLNPALSAMRGSGASSPSGNIADTSGYGEGASAGVNAALAIKGQQAQIALLKAQEQETNAKTVGLVQDNEFKFNSNPGQLDIQRIQIELNTATLAERKQLIPLVVAKAREEVGLTANSAMAARARAILDQYAATGAFNEAEFQRVIGSKGPWVKLLLDTAGKFGVGAIGAGLLLKGKGASKWSKADDSFIRGQRR